MFLQVEDITGDFCYIVDTNNDGLLSLEEIKVLLDRVVFGWTRLSIDELATSSDTNNNGYLSQLGKNDKVSEEKKTCY